MDPAAAPLKTSNKEELLKIFKKIIPNEKWRLLEIASGSGHHAVHIASQLKDLQWVTSDVVARQNAIKKTIKEAKLLNVHGPIVFEVGKDIFPKQKLNAVFASQLIHVISWKLTKTLIKSLGNRLRKGSQVIFYGPFLYGGKYSSARFEELDRNIKAKDSLSGIRAFEDISKVMSKAGFKLVKDYHFADENHLLHFERLEHIKEK